MYELGDIVLNIAMVTATTWIVNRFWGSFYEKRRRNFLSSIVWIVFYIFQFYFECNRGNIHIGITFANIFIFFLISACCYKNTKKEKVFLLFVFYAVWSLIEVFVFFLINGIPIEKEKLDIMGVVISKIIMILFVYIISNVWNRKSEGFVSIKYYSALLIIPIGTVYIAINEFYTKGSSLLSMLTISILLLFNVIIFEIYTKLAEMFIYEKEKTVYAQQIDIISRSTAAQKRMLEEFYEEKHNLVNEIIALKNSVEKSDNETVIKNLNRIVKNSHVSEIISNSGNETVDALLNFKYAIAKEYNIDFRLKIFIPEELPIEQCDIGVVLGNALDNAIEATRKCKNSERKIDISMGIKKEAWIMIIKNPYEHDLKQDRKGKYLSTKEESFRHGYGLSSIKRIAEMYQGDVMIDANNNHFSLTVVMNFKEI